MGIFENIFDQKSEVTEVSKVTAAESLGNPSNKKEGEKLQKLQTRNDSEKDEERLAVMSGSACAKDCGGMQCEAFRNPDYKALASSGLDDMAVWCIEAAQFLFALRLIKDTGRSDFENMCKRHVPYWRKHLDPEGWAIVGCEIKAKMKEYGMAKGGSDERTS